MRVGVTTARLPIEWRRYAAAEMVQPLALSHVGQPIAFVSVIGVCNSAHILRDGTIQVTYHSLVVSLRHSTTGNWKVGRGLF